MVASGTITLTTGTGQTFPGTNARQARVQLIVTNLSGGDILKVQSANGTNGASVQPSTSLTFETSADVIIFNASANSIDFEVLELYPDPGFANLVPLFQTPVTPSGTPGVAGGGTTPSGAPAGGASGSGTSSGGGFISGGSGGARGSQPP
jgi:hypothetical protein